MQPFNRSAFYANDSKASAADISAKSIKDMESVAAEVIADTKSEKPVETEPEIVQTEAVSEQSAKPEEPESKIEDKSTESAAETKPVQVSRFDKINADDFKSEIRNYKSGNNNSDITEVPPPAAEEPDFSDTIEVKREDVINTGERIKRAKSRSVSSNEVKMSTLRDVPTELAKLIQSKFDAGLNNVPMNVAVAAYIYIKENYPENIIIPDKVADILTHYNDESATVSDLQSLMKQEMANLHKQNNELRDENRRLTEKLDAIETAVLYLIFDSAGFRKKEQFSPGEVDFLEMGMDELRTRLNKQASDRRERQRHRDESSHRYG